MSMEKLRYKKGEKPHPLIIYVKYNNGDDVELKIKKEVEIFINYDYMNNYKRKLEFDIGINIPKRGKSEIRNILDKIKNELIKNIKSENIKIDDLYYEDEEKRPNVKTHICSLRSIRNNITEQEIYPIIKINKEDIKKIWTGKEIENEIRPNIEEFIERYKKINKKGLKCFPKLRLILKVEDKYNKENKKYVRYLTLKYNIIQLVYAEDIDVINFTNN